MSDEIKSSLRARLGASVATISVLTTAGVVAFNEVPVLRSCMIYAMLGLGFVGFMLFWRTLVLRRRESSEEEVLRFYNSPAYWGRCLVITSLLVYLIITYFFTERPKPPQVLAKKPPPAEEPQAPEEPEVVEEAPPEFPTLKLTGIVLNGEKSSALIDGEIVQLGERFKGARLVDISEAGIIVEMQGERRTILRHSLRQRTDDPR